MMSVTNIIRRPSMKDYTAHTIRLQDGILFNFRRRVKKHAVTLLSALTGVIDGRSNQGKRHPIENVLFLLFCAMCAGCTNITQCWTWARHNRQFLKRHIEIPHGIPDPTTIAYTLSICDVGSLVAAWNTWRRKVYGPEKDLVVSMDGKTLRGVYGKDVIRHMLSLFTHETQQTIGQIGVSEKENEIPAAIRLFVQTGIAGFTIIADALHTQKDTVDAIRSRHGHYLLIVKENQQELVDASKAAITDNRIRIDTAHDEQYTRGRSIETEITLIHDPDVCGYITSLGWRDVACVGRIRRTGTRIVHGVCTSVDETVYFFSSREDLTAREAVRIIRGHWKIENNLHWQKDHTYDEDHQTVRLGNAPQMMSMLRSMAISLFKLFDFASVTDAVTNFRMSSVLHHRFLAVAAVV